METENIAREKKQLGRKDNEIQLHELQAVFPQAEKLSSSSAAAESKYQVYYGKLS